MLKIKVLQTPGIELDGVPVALPFKRADALLYYMVVRRSASRQELIALLWESDDEAKGLKNLRNALYTLKKALGGEVLISPQKAMITLNPEWEIESDYDRFVQEGDFSAYQGQFLNGFGVKNAFALDEWIFRTREKLHGKFLGGLEEQAKAAYREGNYDEAIRLAGVYLSEEPCDETISAFLMKCLRETNQYARAAQVYQRLKEQLSREMGVDPLESTTMLYYEILNRWNDQARVPEKQTDRTVPVGRERIYEGLRAAEALFLETSSRRSSQLLVGETGSGKSELLNYFLRENRGAMLSVRSECLRSESGKPLAVWARVLRSLVDRAREERLPLPERTLERLEKTVAYDRTLEDSVSLLLSAIGSRRKVLLVLEDLQWADSQSVQLLDAVLRHLERGAVMVVLTSTWNWPDSTSQILAGLEADGLLHRQILRPLSLEDTAEFLRRELGDDAADRLTERFYYETGGNLDLLATLIRDYGKNADVTAALRSMGEILLKRLNGLTDEALLVAENVSIFEQGVSCDLLLEMMEEEPEQVSEALRELRRWLILEEFSYGDILCCRFVHRKMRELVNERLTAYQRSSMHRKAAELLIRWEADYSELICREISGHFRQAGDGRLALEYRLRALEMESRRRCEPFVADSSVKSEERSVEELENDSADCRRLLTILMGSGAAVEELRAMELRLSLIRGRLALFRSDLESGHDLLGDLSAAVNSRDPVLLVRACVLLASAAYYQQSPELAERYISTGMRLMEREQDAVMLARLYRLRGSCFGLRGDYDRAGYYLQEAMDLLEKEQPTAEVRCVQAAVCGDLGRTACSRRDFVHAGRWFKKAMSMVKDTPCAGRVWLYVHYGRTLFAVDDYMRAGDLFREAYSIALERDELWGRTAAAAYCAYFQMTEGDYDLAARTLSEAMACAEQVGSPLEGGILNFVCMRIRRRLDMEQWEDTPLHRLLTDAADDYARRGVRLCSGIPDVFEMQMLSRDLRDGISTQLRYRSSELYSKNKRFMSE